jgi:polyhydroxyalkanoate synthase subunit PhaC
MDERTDGVERKETARMLHEVAQRSSRILKEFGHKHLHESIASVVKDELGIARAYMDLYSRVLMDPSALTAASVNFWIDSMHLWQSAWMKMLGHEAPPVAQPAKGDARFKDEDWSGNFVFDYIKQSYLIAARHIQHAVAGVEGLPEESQKKIAFFTRQYVDALAPSNFAATNPQVLRETMSSGGQNLIKGLNNLLADIEKGEGQLRISMTDERAFQLGKNVATTPGKVVFQNALLQLIQYVPATAQVFRRPLLIIPPWINKYYILDLRASNSFIKWAVEQGHSVFVVSWVNPDKALAQKSFDDYLTEGALAAMDAVRAATGEDKLNVIGYCLGGTLLGATLAWLAAKGDTRVAAATFFVSLLDFSQPGELGVFIDEAQVQNLERRMNERGFLEGSEMASTFNLMRANDLVWSFVINNYLMYMKNLLGVPGGVTLAGVPVDLSTVKVPAYFISTVEDHIAPWKSTYKGASYLGGPVRFVLGGSGHIAGIVNPPAAKKYHYWSNDAFAADADAWLQGATQHPGSWWEDWQRWIAAHNAGDRVPARIPSRAIEDAPGSYVMQRLGKK